MYFFWKNFWLYFVRTKFHCIFGGNFLTVFCEDKFSLYCGKVKYRCIFKVKIVDCILWEQNVQCIFERDLLTIFSEDKFLKGKILMYYLKMFFTVFFVDVSYYARKNVRLCFSDILIRTRLNINKTYLWLFNIIYICQQYFDLLIVGLR